MKRRLPQAQGKQAEVLCLPASGHTVVLGTAGSGKTTMAMHRSVYLANPTTPHGGRTLLLSFNQTLLRYFESFSDLDGANVDVRTYHHFARGYLKRRGRMAYGVICEQDERTRYVEQAVAAAIVAEPLEPALRRPARFLAEEIRWLAQHGIANEAEYVEAERTERAARLPRRERPAVFRLYERYRQTRTDAGKWYDWDDLALAVLGEIPGDDTRRMYRHILVDEGQDFSPMMVRSLAAILPPNGSLTFFGDNAQQIYGGKVSWRSAGLTVRKVYRFEHNYRNPPEVVALALAISKMPYFADTADLVMPPPTVAVGPPVALVTASSEDRELQFAVNRATSLGKAQSVAILTRRRGEDAVLAWMLPKTAVKLHRDMRGWQHTPGIYFGTYAAAKGLEFDAVILPRLTRAEFPSAEDIEAYGEDAHAMAGRTLYVGVTRARSTLILSHTGELTPLLPTEPGLYTRENV